MIKVVEKNRETRPADRPPAAMLEPDRRLRDRPAGSAAPQQAVASGDVLQAAVRTMRRDHLHVRFGRGLVACVGVVRLAADDPGQRLGRPAERKQPLHHPARVDAGGPYQRRRPGCAAPRAFVDTQWRRPARAPSGGRRGGPSAGATDARWVGPRASRGCHQEGTAGLDSPDASATIGLG